MSQSSDGVALPLSLSLSVGFVGLTLRWGPRRNLKKSNIKKILLFWPQNLLSGLFAN